MNFFKGNLVYLRELAGLSQDEFAKNLLRSKRTIGNWENGNTDPSLSDLLELSTFFQIPLTDLVSENLSQKGPDYLKSVLARMDSNITNSETIETLKDVSRLLEELAGKINETSSKIWNSAKALEDKAGIETPKGEGLF